MTFVVGDLHLTSFSPPALAEDAARLLELCRGRRLVVAGDLFDLVTEAPKEDKKEVVRRVLGRHEPLRRALGGLLDRGGELWLCGGNHDADLGDDPVREALVEALGGRGRIRSTPWFYRDRGLHIEHGHFYDPDNAPEHPLIRGEASLGVHFSAEFVHPTGAHRYLLANDGTPLRLFLAAFAWYGPRAPYVIYRYFHAAFAALAKAGPFYRAHGEKAAGSELHAGFAADAGVPAALVDQLFAAGAPSTLRSWSRTFARLYLDRVVSTLLLGAGLGAAAAGRPRGGLAAGTLGAMLMTTSWLRGHDRYRGTVVDRLGAAAGRIVAETDADYVVFGHTHREALDDGYANTGSFAFPLDAPGRPFLEIERGPHGVRARRRYLPATGS